MWMGFCLTEETGTRKLYLPWHGETGMQLWFKTQREGETKGSDQPAVLNKVVQDLGQVFLKDGVAQPEIPVATAGALLAFLGVVLVVVQGLPVHHTYNSTTDMMLNYL